ncbi:phage tail protein [Micromonospora sp. NBC_01813]|uniref:phage tail protein n=1 Tax=Micromonospora sp. NBC_01813 TaxID=2975988 RepID=UPI002DD9AD06|nr:hypothetical protein [Micromonospora sp. NBC_01813]WSA11556.1 hypothetical protein OG958_12675 [Micromonospora sp. NBC_01813]
MADKNTVGKVSIEVGADGSGFPQEVKAVVDKAEKGAKPIEVGMELTGEAELVADAKAASEAAQAAAQDITLKVNMDDLGSVQAAISRVQTELVRLGEEELKVGLNHDDLDAALDLLNERVRDIGVDIRVDMEDDKSIQRGIKEIDKQLELLGVGRTVPIHLELNEAALLEQRKKLSDSLSAQDFEVNIRPMFETEVDPTSKASLQAALDKVRNELFPPLKLRAEMDTPSLRALEVKLRGDIARLERQEQIDLQVAAELSAAEFARMTTLARSLIDAQNLRLPIGANLDHVKVERAVTELTLMLKDRDDLAALIDAELDPFAKTKLATELQHLDAQIKGFAPDVTVDVEPVVPSRARAALSATLALLTRPRTIPIDLDLKEAIAQAGLFIATLSTFKAFTDSLAQARTLLVGLFTNLPNFAAATVGILAMSGAVIALSANLIGLAGSLVNLTPLLLTLPGIAIGFGTLAAALKDLPAQLPVIAAGFQALQGVISEAFWYVARNPIEHLAKKALPLITDGLKSTSFAISAFMSFLSVDLATTFLPGLPSMFGNLAASIGTFTAFTPALANILTMFGQLGSSLLPPLAALMGQVVTEFSAWFETNVAGDQMTATIQNVMAALSGVFEIVQGAAGVFGALFAAASAGGASSFGSLGASLQGIADTLREMQPILTTFFQSAGALFAAFSAQAGDGLRNAFTGITEILSAVLPTIGSTLGKVMNVLGDLLNNPAVIAGFTAFIDGVSQGITALLPAFVPLASLLGALGPTLGLLATQIGQTLGALAPSFGGILEALMPLITVLSTNLQSVLIALGPVIQQIADVLAQAFANPALHAAIGAIADALIAVIPALSPILGLLPAIMDLLAGALLSIAGPLAGLIGQLAPAFGLIAEILPQVFAAIAPLIPLVMDLLVSILEPLIPLVVLLASAILPLLVPVLQLVSVALQAVISALSAMLGIILPPLIVILTNLAGIIGVVSVAIGAAITWITEWMEKGLGKMQESAGKFIQWWQENWDKVLEYWKGLWESVISWVKDFLGIRSPSRVFIEIATNLIDGLLNGLTAGWGKVTAFFSAAFQWVKDTAVQSVENVIFVYAGLWGRVTGAIGDLAGRVRSFFGTAWGKIHEALISTWNTVSGWLSGFGSRVVSTIGDLGSTLISVGTDLINGFITGIRDMAGAVTSAINTYVLDKIPSQIKQFFGINSPSRMFIEFGSFLMQGLALGIENQADTVMRALQGVMSEVSDAEFRAPSVALGVSPGSYGGSDGTSSGNTLIYHAAPGGSLSAEEDLFSAIGRARAFGW